MEKKNVFFQIISACTGNMHFSWELNLTGYAISKPWNVDEYLATTGVVIE